MITIYRTEAPTVSVGGTAVAVSDIVSGAVPTARGFQTEYFAVIASKQEITGAVVQVAVFNDTRLQRDVLEATVRGMAEVLQ